MRMGKTTELIAENKVNALHLADDILSEVNILQKVQRFYVDDVSQLALESQENALQRLDVLDFIGEAILEHMEEIDEGLSTLINMIRALQKNSK